MEQLNDSTKSRKWKQLTERDRYKIEGFYDAGMKPSEIARAIGCSTRTIQREIKMGLVPQMVWNTYNIKENGDYVEKLVYRADFSQSRHDENASLKGRGLKIGNDFKLVDFIEEKIKNKWSPGAVIGYIREKGLVFRNPVCEKTLYNYIHSGLFINIDDDDLTYPRQGKGKGGVRHRTVPLNNRNGKGIEERPPEIDSREEFGHWEIDLVVGKAGTRPVILTLVERKARKSIYVKSPSKRQKDVLRALRRAARKVKGDFGTVFKTITADNGSEFLDGAGIKAATGSEEVYYTHPYSSWEKGSNENGNRMLRRFLPKGTDFTKLTNKQLQRIEDWVNNYPRKMFGYKSANEMYKAA